MERGLQLTACVTARGFRFSVLLTFEGRNTHQAKTVLKELLLENQKVFRNVFWLQLAPVFPIQGSAEYILGLREISRNG